MATPQIDAYDEFFYPNYSYPQTHADRLGSLATLFGMTAAPAERCRVLELGCGDGANLLPMAFGLPESQFFGIDRAAQPIAKGARIIADLQLKNLELRQLDLLASPVSLGQFDYIIAHGVYSWVPAAVRDRILEICRSCLAPQGVAYISYNVYPGCHLREITRGMLLLHTRDVKDPHQRVDQSRALVKWIADAQTQANAYSLFLREVKDSFTNKNDGAIYHDDLADVNAPVYFHQFIAHAARHGLQFLSEAEYFDTQEYNFPVEVAQQLRLMSQDDIIGSEQYLDFLEGRSFRQTLLCHSEAKLDRSLRSDLVRQFHIRSQARPVSADPDLKSEAIEEFRGSKECSIATSFPLAKAAMLHLGTIYPRSARFNDLLAQAHELLGTASHSREADSEEAQTLAEVILKTYGAGVAEFRLHEPKFALIPGERPLASPLARLQAQQGSMITSLLYNSVKLDDLLGRKLLLLLDGTRDRSALLRDFSQIVEQSIQASSEANDPTVESETLLHTLADQLEEKLCELGRLGLLLA
jgi:methyltransferase-like protein/SAM-dependent methyltransferase